MVAGTGIFIEDCAAVGAGNRVRPATLGHREHLAAGLGRIEEHGADAHIVTVVLGDGDCEILAADRRGAAHRNPLGR